VTGKLTDDASNVWRCADGTWSHDLQKAGVVSDEATAKAQAAAASAKEQRQITDPYVIEVHAADGGAIDPLTARERIRATGPTVHTRRVAPGLGR
jgi:hypothetical protein